MTYQYHLHSTPKEVDQDAWETVQRHDPHPFSDLRFLRVIEQTLCHDARCWPLLITDEHDRPAAIACLSLFEVDGGILAGPIIRTVAAGMRHIRSRFLRLPVLILGLPVSTGHSSVVIRDDADVPSVHDALLRAIVEVERRERPSLTLAKEFDDRQADELRGLVQAGFLEVSNLPMHEFPTLFADFDEYYRQRSRRHRYNIRKTRQKLEQGGIEVKHLCAADGALDYLTEDVHRLWVAVYERSATKFEFLPLEFFREMARLFPNECWFTFLIQGDRVVAFSFRLAYRQCVHLMFLGIDYDLNREFDLYFNILYEELDWSLRRQPQSIYFGQNSPDVKQRLGCRQSRRTLFIRGHRLWHPLIKNFSQFIFRTGDVQPSRLEEPASAATSTSPAET